MGYAKGLFFVCMVIFGFTANAEAVQAKKIKAKTIKEPEKHASLVVDATTGKVLHAENAHKPRYPASLTKMMTLYLAFEAIEEGTLRFEDSLKVSRVAASRPKSNMDLKPDQRIKVKDAIMGLIVKSANDAAVVVAEAISGSEEAFAKKMCKRAKELGMTNTRFKNASGLPDREQKTTAHDLAKLALALRRDFPKHYHLFAKTDFEFNGSSLEGHNKITKNYDWADGLKTGYIRDSGFNIVTSANKDGKKLIAVVMGGKTSQERDKKVVSLIERYLDDPRVEAVSYKTQGINNRRHQNFEVSEDRTARVK